MFGGEVQAGAVEDAARARVGAGVFGSTIDFSKVVAAYLSKPDGVRWWQMRGKIRVLNLVEIGQVSDYK
jgi:hypothetical protein